MENDSNTVLPKHLAENQLTETTQDALIAKLGSGRRNKYARFILAALSSIPWIGGLLSAAASLSAEKEQGEINDLQRMWVEEHKQRTKELGATLGDIFIRLDNFGEEARKKIESPEYLSLVKTAFRSWDAADTEEKKQMLKRLITNAGATNICSDDLIRLFIHWIDLYHETHFRVMKEIYRNPRCTRARIWDSMSAQRPREDSAEADLFRYLIRDLSVGGVVRQERETDYQGRFMKKETKDSRDAGSRTMESAFEDTKPYVLTELGKKFLHYVMDDIVPQIGAVAESK
jgi:hypothetical protein